MSNHACGGEATRAEDDTILSSRIQFVNKDLEAEFQAWQFSTVRSIVLLAVAVLLVTCFASLAVDVWFHQGSAVFAWLLGIRLGAIGLCSITLTLLIRNPWHDRTRQITEYFVVIFLLLSLWLTLTHESYQVYGPISQIGTLFAIYFLCPFTWQRQVAYAMSFSLIGLCGWWYKMGLVADFFRIFLWMAFANSLGAVVARLRHLHERQLFSGQRRLTRQLEFEQLLQRQKASMIDLLTHELRNPLAIIHAQAELIKRLDEPVAMRGMADKIVQSSTRSAALIREWIQGDRIAGATVPGASGDDRVSPIKVVQEVARDLARRYPELKVSIHDCNVPPVMIERRLLALVVLNVFENAARYAFSDRGIEVRFRYGPRRVILRIRDFGPGLSPNDQECIFQKHVRLAKTAEQHEGTGVGLYLVRQMLELGGAHIRVQSVVGRGSAFLIELPKAD